MLGDAVGREQRLCVRGPRRLPPEGHEVLYFQSDASYRVRRGLVGTAALEAPPQSRVSHLAPLKSGRPNQELIRLSVGPVGAPPGSAIVAEQGDDSVTFVRRSEFRSHAFDRLRARDHDLSQTHVEEPPLWRTYHHSLCLGIQDSSRALSGKWGGKARRVPVSESV